MTTELIVLTDDEIATLTPEEQQAYLQYLEAHEDTWALQPKQQLAEMLTETCDEVGYGGAAGGGKSDWGLYHVYNLAQRIPKYRALVLRTVFPELRRSLIARSLQKFDPKVATYRPAEKEWKFKDNGSVIEFGYLDSDDSVYQYKSAEYDCIFFDEVTELTEFQYDYLKSRCRTTTWKRKLGARPHIICATNPGGKGHGWFKRRFVKATNHGERVVETDAIDPISGQVVGTRRVAFVPATLLDNAFIDPDYKLNLLALPDVEMRQLLYGDWDVFAGQFFSDWRHEIHVVLPFTIPTSWPRVRGIDYGFANPFCCLWVAFDWDSNAYLYREVYETRLTAAQQAKLIIERSRMIDDQGENVPEKVAYTVADPAIWAKQGSGVSIAQQYAENRLPVKRAMNARIDGWSRLREWLRPDDETHEARLRVFPACANLIRTLPELVHDKDRPEDLDTDGEDHAADTIRYIAMSRPRRAKRPHMENTADNRIARDLARYDRPNRPSHPVLGSLNL